MFKKITQNSEKYYLPGILLLAFWLRLRQIALRDFWYDEAFTGVAIKENFSGMIHMIIKDIHPPLYYASVKIFASFYHYSVFGIRLFSAIFGVLGVWAVYLFARELFGKKAGLWAAFITAISPFAIQYSQEARMYTMFVFFIIIAGYFLVRALKTERLKYYLLWGIFGGLACLTHYMGIIFIPVFYLGFVFWKINNLKFEKKSDWLKRIYSFLPTKNILFGLGAGLAVFSFWIMRLYHHLMDINNNLDWVRPASFSDIFYTIQMFFLGTPLGEMSAGMPNPNEVHFISKISLLTGIIIFLTLISLNFFRKESEKRKEISLVFVFSFGFLLTVYLVSLLGRQFFVARYLMPGAYFIFVYIAFWLSRVNWKIAASIFAFYLFLILNTTHLPYSRGWNEFEKDLSRFQGKDFYILNSFDYVLGEYYLGKDRLILYNMDWPQYNPYYWAAIGNGIRREESFDAVKNNPNAVILSNAIRRDQISERKDLNMSGLKVIEQYKNIKIYDFE